MSNSPSEPTPPVHTNQEQRQIPPQRIPQTAADGDTMERLFQVLFYRIAVLYARTVPKQIRRLEETAILVMV